MESLNDFDYLRASFGSDHSETAKKNEEQPSKIPLSIQNYLPHEYISAYQEFEPLEGRLELKENLQASFETAEDVDRLAIKTLSGTIRESDAEEDAESEISSYADSDSEISSYEWVDNQSEASLDDFPAYAELTDEAEEANVDNFASPRQAKIKHTRASSDFEFILKQPLQGEVFELEDPDSETEEDREELILERMREKYPDAKYFIEDIADYFKDPAELENIFNYIETNKEQLLAESSKLGTNKTLYKSHKETNLARTIQVTSDQKIYIHLYKKSEENEEAELGRGNHKKVTYALDYGNMEIIAKATTKLANEKILKAARKEEDLLNKFKGKEGFLDVYGVTYQAAKKGEDTKLVKQHIWMPVYSKTLAKLKKSYYSFQGQDFKNVIVSGLKGLKKMHDENIAHRDVTLENLFVCFTPKGYVSNVLLSDFGLATPLGESPKKVHHQTLPPEGPGDGIANDLWGFGLILYFLKNSRYPPYIENFNKTLDMNFNQLINDKTKYPELSEEERRGKLTIEAVRQTVPVLQSSYTDLPEPKDPASLDHLIWQMLRVDKSQRISLDKVLNLVEQGAISDL